MKKTKILFTGMLAALAISGAQAQVKDVSITASPLVEYNWWNNNFNLKNGPFYGARLGFGFGQFFELRAIAEKSIDLKASIKAEGKSVDIEGVNLDITRFGAEAKFNILGSYGLSPYITAGTGVQVFNYDPFDSKTFKRAADELSQKEQQIYLSLGAGIKLGLSDRAVLSLEAKNLRFNMDSNNPYINPSASDKNNKLGVWSAVASLDFYLGGNTSAEADKYGRAYHSIFTDGFVGPKFVVEPGIAYVDFNKNISREDQWFVGGSAGVDFSSLVGVRAFYYQATKNPNKLNFDFNKDVKMYGANVITRLNYPRGIVPYLSLGAGYLDTNDLLKKVVNGKEEISNANQKNIFALAGAGVEVPISKYFALFGTANAMFSTDKDQIKETSKPSHILRSMMYTTGIRINIGVPASAPEYAPETSATEATVNKDINSIREGAAQQAVAGETCKAHNAHKTCPMKGKMMTKKEFEEMVNRIVKKIQAEENATNATLSDNDMSVVLAALNQKKISNQNTSNQELVNEIRTLVNTLKNNNNNRPATTSVPAAVIVSPEVAAAQQQTEAQVAPVTRVANPDMPECTTSTCTKFGFLKMNRASVITGLSFGENTMWNIGARAYMQISNTNLDFVPELFIGTGSKNGYGLSGNVVYNLNLDKSVVSPYVGLGLGYFDHGNGGSFGSNIILGANINVVKNGALFVDYSARNVFKNNQIAVGYRFVF